MVKQIFHIADLCINAQNKAHIQHVWAQLMAAILAVPAGDAMLVIAGGVFGSNAWLTPEEITVFNAMAAELEAREIWTVIAPDPEGAGGKIWALIGAGNYKHIAYLAEGPAFVDNIALFRIGQAESKTTYGGFRRVGVVYDAATVHAPRRKYAGAQCDMVLGGGLDQRAQIAPNIAFSGAFVQRSRVDGAEHGYLLWDVAAATCKFVPLVQLSLYMALELVDDMAPVQMPANPRGIRVYHTRCTDAWLSAYMTHLRNTYKCEIADPVSRAQSADDGDMRLSRVQSAEFEKALAAKLAETTGADPRLPQGNERFARILTMHRQLMNAERGDDAAVGMPGDWNIHYLEWDGLYCYGAGNHINFDDIRGLASIVGPNGIGKSSVIDILVLVLYNESVRGSKSGALNTTAKCGHIRCIFSVSIAAATEAKTSECAAARYTVERYWPESKPSKVRLYRDGVNISGADMSGTYAKIEQLIGPKRTFLNSIAALQDRQYLVDISSKERYELISRMIGLDRLRVIEDQNKAEIRALRKQTKAGESDAAISALTAQLTATRAAANAYRAESLKVQAELKRIDSGRGDIQSQIHNVDDARDFSDRIKALESFKEPRDWGEIAALRVRKQELEPRLNSLAAKLAELAMREQHLRASLVDIAPTTLSPSEGGDEDLPELTAAYSAALARKEQAAAELSRLSVPVALPACRALKDVLADLQAVGVAASADTATIEANIAALKSAIAELRPPPRDHRFLRPSATLSPQILSLSERPLAALVADIDAQERLIDRLKASQDVVAKLAICKYPLQWAGGCAACAHNRHMITSGGCSEQTDIQSSLQVAREYLGVLGAAAAICADAMEAHVSRELAVKAAQLEAATRELAAVADAKGRQARLMEEMKAAESAAEAQAAARGHEGAIRVKRAELGACEAEVARLAGRMQSVEALFRARAQQPLVEKNRETRARIIAIVAELTAARAQHEQMGAEFGSVVKELEAMETYKARHQELAELERLYKLAEENDVLYDEQDKLASEAERAHKVLGATIESLVRCEKECGVLGARLEAMVAQAKQNSEDMARISDREAYDVAISHRGGVPDAMMVEACAKVEAKCNRLLYAACGFRIQVRFAGEVHMDIVSGGATVAAEHASGFQKFVIDIVMRYALCCLNAARPHLLFVDEGFGSADEQNFGAICTEVLPELVRRFDRVIVISHIPLIHGLANMNCRISTVGGKSQLQIGARDPEPPRFTTEKEAKAPKAAKATTGEKKAGKETKAAKAAADAKECADTYGESIMVRADDKHLRCLACGKDYRATAGFAAKHVKTAAHTKALLLYKPGAS